MHFGYLFPLPLQMLLPLLLLVPGWENTMAASMNFGYLFLLLLQRLLLPLASSLMRSSLRRPGSADNIYYIIENNIII